MPVKMGSHRFLLVRARTGHCVGVRCRCGTSSPSLRLSISSLLTPSPLPHSSPLFPLSLHVSYYFFCPFFLFFIPLLSSFSIISLSLWNSLFFCAIFCFFSFLFINYHCCMYISDIGIFLEMYI